MPQMASRRPALSEHQLYERRGSASNALLRGELGYFLAVENYDVAIIGGGPAGSTAATLLSKAGRRVIVLERDRHARLIADLREAGARVTLIRDGDVAPAIAAAHGGVAGVDVLMGIGGTPEGVIAAAAIKCLGGALQALPAGPRINSRSFSRR